MLHDQQWQPIPGAAGAEIYPLTRRPDVSCSNAYIIRTASEILIIDTGADSAQMAEIVERVRDETVTLPRPVLLVITHCHLDHCFAIIRDEALRAVAPLTIAAQEDGARALASADKALTVSDLFHWEIKPLAVDLHLLNAADRAHGGIRTVELAGGGRAVLSMKVPGTAGDLSFSCQTVLLGSGERLEVYHVPGHTPDSICIRIGECLFIGDLLFATAPGIAGIAGWDPSALSASLEGVRWLLESEPICLCCSGHGRAVPAAAVAEMLPKLQREAAAMAGIGVFDPERLRRSREEAIDLLAEANRLFSVIAGRLYSLAYALEELGEAEEGQRYQNLIEADRIDEFLVDFGRFAGEFSEGKKIELQLVLKAVQIIQRIGQVFAQDRLDHVVDASLLRRADRLLSDFMDTVCCYPSEGRCRSVDLNTLISDLVKGLHVPPLSDEAFIEAADDDDAYREALVARLAYLPLFEETCLDVSLCESPLPVMTDAERLSDALTGVLEDLVSAGVTDIRLTTSLSGCSVLLGIAYPGCALPGTKTGERLRLYRREFLRCGAGLASRDGNGVSELCIALNTADALAISSQENDRSGWDRA
ncbi:MBL fold metallo-hydrolase [Methanoculleus frigidifontis]|uniref:MBL fold metallo-hydrolase n=1 Tax=Methanoculleus frigidifontis TaxID=2584085 RepID=UPI00265913C3|nr:MBL fold metallo-hydrolase [Methanoculleus sp. FWC-SCC1]